MLATTRDCLPCTWDSLRLFYVCCPFFFLIIKFYFYSSFRSTIGLSIKCREFLYLPIIKRAQPPLRRSTPHTVETCLLQSMSLSWLIVVTLSPVGFTLGFSVIHSVGFNKCIICIHHCSIKQKSSTVQKSPVLCPFILLPSFWAITDLYCLHSFAHSTLS